MSRRKRKSKSAKKALKPVFRIYTEGESTEIHYIEAYVQDYVKSRGYFGPRIHVEQPKKFKPKDLLAAALENQVPGDPIWLVFDCDKHPDKDEVFRSAGQNSIRIAYSSFCFEEWLLLHYGYTAKSYSNCAGIIRELETFLKTPYEKARIDLFAEVAGENNCNVASARKNAKRLCRKMHTDNPGMAIWELNPYTNVHELLDAIDAFIEQEEQAFKNR